MSRLISDTGIIDDQWHPLDGVPAPEYIPEIWDGVHVGVRLVEAFKTLMRLPGARAAHWNCWPEYCYEWEDMLARIGSDADLREQEARAQNRARLMPSTVDVSRMEKAIGWAASYLKHVPRTARLVQKVAFYRSREFALEQIARRLRRNERLIRRENRHGLDLIATGLRRDDVSIF